MSEKEFRAWHRESQAMLYVGDSFGTTHPLDCCVFSVQRQPVDLMQYIFANAADGRKIFEGDIIRVNYGKGGTRLFLVLELGAHGAMFKYIGKSGGIYFWQDLHQRESIIIVGNKYANPELLEAQP